MEGERRPEAGAGALVVRDLDARGRVVGPGATARVRGRTRIPRGRSSRARVSTFEPAPPEATGATTARRQARRSPAGAAQLRPSVDPDASRAGVDALGSGAVGRHDRRRLLEFAGAGARRPALVAADVRGRTRASRFPGADSPSRTRPAARSGDRPRTPGGVPSPPDACLPAGAASINGRPRRPFRAARRGQKTADLDGRLHPTPRPAAATALPLRRARQRRKSSATLPPSTAPTVALRRRKAHITRRLQPVVRSGRG